MARVVDPLDLDLIALDQDLVQAAGILGEPPVGGERLVEQLQEEGAVDAIVADHDDGVMSCSALKRRYRDQLRSHRTDIAFLHLTGSPELISTRQSGRPGHFMPSSLLVSQFDALEPLDPDEYGMAIDVGQSVDTIVEAFVKFLSVSP